MRLFLLFLGGLCGGAAIKFRNEIVEDNVAMTPIAVRWEEGDLNGLIMWTEVWMPYEEIWNHLPF